MRTPKNVAFGYDFGKICTGCLVLKTFLSCLCLQNDADCDNFVEAAIFGCYSARVVCTVNKCSIPVYMVACDVVLVLLL